MALDPIDYDVVALRELAQRKGDHYIEDGFLWLKPSEGGPPIDEFAEFDREAIWTGSLDERQKPYLKTISEESEAREHILEWLGGLIEAVGFEETVNVLAYYESLGWITETVEEELHGYLLGAGNASGGRTDGLEQQDHIESLSRIVTLAQFDSAREK
jgi:flagellar protein FlaE